MATCESDFTEVRGWFGIHAGFGPSNRVTLQVEPDHLAHQFGYKTGGATFIKMDPLNDFKVQEQADDGVQGLFVAEIIEVLMDYRNIKNKKISWHANMSEGEGLSRVAAAALHPVGYYSALPGPFVNAWLENERQVKRTSARGGIHENWVTTNDPTDSSEDSYGCAILFIYYLRDQLNFRMSAIIQKAGDSLENTYQALTGSSNGFQPFKALLDKYLPAGQMQDLVSDNPFPILEGQDRGVITKMLSFSVPPGYRRRERPASRKLGPFRAWIDAILESDRSVHKKQRWRRYSRRRRRGPRPLALNVSSITSTGHRDAKPRAIRQLLYTVLAVHDDLLPSTHLNPTLKFALTAQLRGGQP